MVRGRKAAQGTSLRSSPRDDPPWERAIGAFLRLCEDSESILVELVDRTGRSRSAVVDALLRGLPVGELEVIVRSRLGADADARDAWSRATR